MNLSGQLRKLKRNKFISFGLPFLTFVIGSSFVIENFASVRYAIHKYYHLNIPPELLEKMKKSGEKFAFQDSIDEEYQKMKKTLDIDNWNNIRGPREFEDMSTEYKQQIEFLKEKNRIKVLESEQ